MEFIVAHWFAAVAAHLACRAGEVVWVQLDSLGRFDIVLPTFHRGECARVEWRALRPLSGRFEACTEQAFVELFPPVGPRLLRRLQHFGHVTAVSRLRDS